MDWTFTSAAALRGSANRRLILRRQAAHPPSGGADGCLSPLTVAEIGGRENGYSADKGVDEPLRRAAPHGITVPARFQQRQRAASVVSGAVR